MARQRRLVGARAVEKDTPKLMITPMIDMFTILLVFLLMSFKAAQIHIYTGDDLVLPDSTSRVAPEMAINIVVSKTAIFVDETKIVDLEEYQVPKEAREAGESYTIRPLLTLLEEEAKKGKAIEEKSKRGDVFEGNVILQGDQDLPFNLLRDVMFTAGQAEYSNFRFLVLKKVQAQT